MCFILLWRENEQHSLPLIHTTAPASQTNANVHEVHSIKTGFKKKLTEPGFSSFLKQESLSQVSRHFVSFFKRKAQIKQDQDLDTI